jgi:hypothetical protein
MLLEALSLPLRVSWLLTVAPPLPSEACQPPPVSVLQGSLPLRVVSLPLVAMPLPSAVLQPPPVSMLLKALSLPLRVSRPPPGATSHPSWGLRLPLASILLG